MNFYDERIPAREQLSEIGKRRYDIELKRLKSTHEELTAQHKVDVMARRWFVSEQASRDRRGVGLTDLEI